MKKYLLFKIFLLFNGILFIFALCPGSPTIPATSIPKSDFIVLTSASEGMESVTSSGKQIAISMIVNLDEECPAGSNWYLLVLESNDYKVAKVYIKCDTFGLYIEYRDVTLQAVEEIFTGSSRNLNVFLTVDLSQNLIDFEVKSQDKYQRSFYYYVESQSYSFDDSTQLSLCSNFGEASALSCTISHLELLPIYAKGWGRLGDFTPVTKAFYPLIDGKLESEITSAPSGYFGDSASSPTAGTSPSWDSSNSFVKITSETQFLTFPLVPLTNSDPLSLPTMSGSMWIRLTSSTEGTSPVIFSIYSDDDGEMAACLVDTSFGFMKVYIRANSDIVSSSSPPPITLDTWHFIHFNLTASPDRSSYDLDVFIGGEWVQTVSTGITDLSGLSLRIGDATLSFIGDVSAVQLLSPGVRFLTQTDACSSDIQIGYDPYALSCSAGASFNPNDNKCYSSCPADFESVTPFTDAPFTLCLADEKPEEPEEPEVPGKPSGSITAEESGGLSGGAIAGIVVGSVAAVAGIAAVGYFVKIKAAKSAANWVSKMKANVDYEKAPNSNLVSPANIEEIPIK